MNQENKNAPGEGAALDNGGAAVAMNILSQTTPLSRATLWKLSDIAADLVDFYLDHSLLLVETTDVEFNRPFSRLILCFVVRAHLLKMLGEPGQNALLDESPSRDNLLPSTIRLDDLAYFDGDDP